MCIIIDADMAHKFGNPNKKRKPHPDALPVLNRLMDPSGISLALGGKLTEELFILAVMRELVNELHNVGRVCLYQDNIVEQKTNLLIDSKSCKSNDPHTIALAQISGARVLYTGDGALRQDFTNPYLINKPAGKVYQSQSDARLLENPPKCLAPATSDL